jgi:hypothetical protein
MAAEKENASKQVQSLRTDAARMRMKQQQIDQQASKELPANKVCAFGTVMREPKDDRPISSAHAGALALTECATCLYQGLFSLYHNISKIRWDGECTGLFKTGREIPFPC